MLCCKIRSGRRSKGVIPCGRVAIRWSLEDLEEWLLIGSTLVEGSTLSEQDARDVLAGLTVSGHPVIEARELLNYRAGTAWLMEQLERSPYVSQDLVRDFHRRLLDGLADDAGHFKTRQNYVLRSDGSRHDYLRPGPVAEAPINGAVSWRFRHRK